MTGKKYEKPIAQGFGKNILNVTGAECSAGLGVVQARCNTGSSAGSACNVGNSADSACALGNLPKNVGNILPKKP